MNQPPLTKKQSSKRIVSKGAYVQMWGIRLGLVGITGGLFCITMFSVGITVLSLLGLVLCLCTGAGFALPCLAFSSFFALLSYLMYNLWKWGEESLKHFAEPQNMLPFTRANTAALPAPDSLVRASEQPQQAQESVLLRAVAQGVETPSEQLVRASAGME